MYRKFNRVQKDKVLEACRAAAKVMNSATSQILSDTSIVCSNDLLVISEFLETLKPHFDKLAWEHTSANFIKYLPTEERAKHLCSYDFYRALNKAHYFSAEGAIKRIREFGELLVVPGFNRRRMNLKGALSWCSSSSEWFVNEINANWKLFLAIAARVSSNDQRSSYWKNWRAYRENPIKAVRVNNTTFDIHIQGKEPDITRIQVDNFLLFTKATVFAQVSRPSQNCYRVVIQKEAGTSETEDKQDPFRLEGTGGNPNFIMMKGVNVFQPKHTLIEDHYAGEIEKSINEITAIVDDYDRQIDELTAKADKMRAQRGKLLRAYKALTE